MEADAEDFQFDILEMAKSENYKLLLDLCLDNLDLYAFPVNKADANGNTLLHLMATKGDVFLAHKLLKLGAAVNPTNKNGETPLHLATRLAHLDTVTLLINFGARITLKDWKGECVLFKAAQSGRLEILKFIAKLKNVQVEDLRKISNRDGDNLLHATCDPLMVKFLVEEVGLDVNAQNFSGNTPLVECILSGERVNYPLVGFLIKEGGATVDVGDCKSRTLLHLAVLRNDALLLKFLLDNCTINPDSSDYNGCTPLHYAVELNSSDLVTLLVCQGGADVNHPDLDLYTPLHVAAIFDRESGEILRTLLENCADPKARTFNGDSPLHLAGAVGNAIGVRLLNCDSFKSVRITDGLTPAHLARLKGHKTP